MEIDRRHLDAVAPVRRNGVVAQTVLDHREQGIARVGAQHVIHGRRQRGGFVGTVVDAQIDENERADQCDRQRVRHRAVTRQARHGPEQRERAREPQEREAQNRQRVGEFSLLPRDEDAGSERQQHGAGLDGAARQAAAPVAVGDAMHEIARDDRQQRAEQERRVGGPAEKIGAGRMEGEREDRRVLPSANSSITSAAIAKTRISFARNPPRRTPSVRSATNGSAPM